MKFFGSFLAVAAIVSGVVDAAPTFSYLSGFNIGTLHRKPAYHPNSGLMLTSNLQDIAGPMARARRLMTSSTSSV